MSCTITMYDNADYKFFSVWLSERVGVPHQSHITSTSFRAAPRVAIFMDAAAAAAPTAAESSIAAFPP